MPSRSLNNWSMTSPSPRNIATTSPTPTIPWACSIARTGRPSEAESAYHEALKIQRDLASRYPRVPIVRDWLADTHHSLGNLLRETGRMVEAEATYLEAVGLFEALDRDYPRVVEYLTDLANTSTDLAILYSRTGRPSETAACCRRAIEIREGLPRKSSSDFFQLAALYAFSADLLVRARVDSAAEEDLPPYADRAMDRLRDAMAAGFTDAGRIRSDPELEPLKTRADFQMLLMDLAFPRVPFAP